MKENILICPDSFKGSFSSKEVSLIIKDTLLELDPTLNITLLPIADGGEGSIEAINEIIPIKKINIKVHGPSHHLIDTYYGEINKSTAIIESALIIGLALKNKGDSPINTSSFGLGEAIKDAINKGYSVIYLCLGGSATNDGGCGLLSALGMKFFDRDDKSFIPKGGTLKDIARIDDQDFKETIKNTNFITLLDVNNPLLGDKGATYTFARQKGASEEDLIILEEGMINFSNIIKKQYKEEITSIPGLGAAGGIAASSYFFLKSKMLQGIETILDIIHFDDYLSKNEIIISGEGKLDSQSLEGKVISGIISHNQKYNKDLYLVVGINELNIDLIPNDIKGIYETNINHLPFEEILIDKKPLLIEAIKRLYNDIK